MVKLRVACEHGRWDSFVYGHYDTHNGALSADATEWISCPGGREPTQQELWAYAKSKGWINYEAAAQAVQEDKYRPGEAAMTIYEIVAHRIVDAALRGEQE